MVTTIKDQIDNDIFEAKRLFDIVGSKATEIITKVFNYRKDKPYNIGEINYELIGERCPELTVNELATNGVDEFYTEMPVSSVEHWGIVGANGDKHAWFELDTPKLLEVAVWLQAMNEPESSFRKF